MTSSTVEKIVFSCLAPIALLYIFAINGAIPFVLMPTSGQALWSMGFAESLAQGPIWQLRADNFGLPRAAPIAFGLAGILPASIFLRLGFDPSEAYAFAAMGFLTLGSFACWRLCRRFGVGEFAALLAVVTWMSMPMIWQHVGYSVLSWAFAILPLYFWAILCLLGPESQPPGEGQLRVRFAYVGTVVLAVFMDGYNFIMFFCCASAIFLHAYVRHTNKRRYLGRIVLPLHLASFVLAYVLFALYFGESEFSRHPDEAFRAWGLDLSFALIPTAGSLLLPDLLGLSVVRTNDIFFGDSSAYKTTFALPIICVGIAAWMFLRNRSSLANALMIVAFLSFYMSLGPSFKFFSTKPDDWASVAMPAEFALGPTGTNWITTHLPGFNVMRSAYRWMAPCIFSLWLLVCIAIANSRRPYAFFWLVGLVVVSALHIPRPAHLNVYVNARGMVVSVENDLVTSLKQDIQKNELVAFVPWGNDFLVNYLASRVEFRTFNVGGDKNLANARPSWPEEMQGLGQPFAKTHIYGALLLLQNTETDAFVIPYFDLLQSAEKWLIPSDRNNANRDRPAYAEAIVALKELPFLEVTERATYAVVRLKSGQTSDVLNRTLAKQLYGGAVFPVDFGTRQPDARRFLRSGWHDDEAEHVWSTGTAEFVVPPITGCSETNCAVEIAFTVFAATPDRPVKVQFSRSGSDTTWNHDMTSTQNGVHNVTIPVEDPSTYQTISIEVPEATSPKKLHGAQDGRVLGIAIQHMRIAVR